MNSQKAMLLILESDLSERYTFIEEQLKLKKIVFDLQNILKHSIFKLFISRLKYKKYIHSEYKKYKKDIAKYNIIFISNGEGFIAKNILNAISNDFPEKTIITLQHGIFVPKSLNLWKQYFRKILNILSRLFLGFRIIGTGFGSIKTDKIIVYNSVYKSLLVKQGWKNEDVIISSFLLKGRLFETATEDIRMEKKKSDKVIFFLQPLTESGCVNEETEKELNKKVIDKLSRSFQKIYVKEHPLSEKKDQNYGSNIEVISSNIGEYVSKSDCIVSYFSTALLDYELESLDSVAIYTKEIKVDRDIYTLFKYIHHLDENQTDGNFSFIKNDAYLYDENYFFESGMNTDELIRIL